MMLLYGTVLLAGHGLVAIDPEVVAAVRQSTQSLPAFSCRIKKSRTGPNGAVVWREGFMVRSPNLVRLFIQGEEHSEDRSLTGTTLSVWTRTGRGSIEAAIRPATAAGICEADILAVSEWRFFVGGGTIVELADFLEDRTIPKEGAWKSVDSDQRYVVKYKLDWPTAPPSSSTYELELSSQRHYIPIVKRCVYRYIDQDGKDALQDIVMTVEEFEPLSTGQYIPKKCRVVITSAGKQIHDATTTATDLSENAADFEKYPPFQFPLGARVFDHINRSSYVVAENGRQDPILKNGKEVRILWDGPEKDEIRTPAADRIRALSSLGPTGYNDSVISGRLVILLVACLTLALAAAIWYKRTRSRTQP